MRRAGWGLRSAATLVSSAILCAAALPALAQYGPCWDCDEPDATAIPFQWEDGAQAPPEIAPYPQGFALTVPVTPGATPPGNPGRSLDRYAEVATALGRCWSPLLDAADARWRDVTLRVSFRRDGSVNGVPRIVHVSAPADPEAMERGRRSLLAALGRCTPLAFSPSLGRAIAGQIFAIRFVQQRTS